MIEATKACSRCKKTLPISAFCREWRSKSGLRSQCRPCNNRYPKKPARPRTKMDARAALIEALRSGERLTYGELSRRTGHARGTIRRALMALRKVGAVHSMFNTWGLGPEPSGLRAQMKKERVEAARVKRSIREGKMSGSLADDGSRIGKPKGLYEVDGQMLTTDEVVKLTGLKRNTIWSRVRKGIPLTAPLLRGGRPGANGEGSIFDDSVPYKDDPRAQAALGYLKRCEPLMTEDEIFELFQRPEEVAAQRALLDDELGRGRGSAVCSREEARALRAFLAHGMGLGGGLAEASTLDEIGEFMGVCRERVRQIEREALDSAKRAGRRLGVEKRTVDDLRLADESRRETHAQRAENMGSADPGGLSDWNEKVTMASIAKRSGRSFDPKAPINIRKAS